MDHSAGTDGHAGAMSAMRDMAGRAMFALASGGRRELLRQFRRDQSGAYLIIAGLLMPVLVGFVGLGTDATLWYNQHRKMQDTADSAAVSAATAFSNGVNNVTPQANAVASSYGFVNGTNSVTVTVNQPPLSGTNKATAGAIEVIVAQPQRRLFSVVFGSGQAAVSARAVAAATAGTGCVLTLDKTLKGAATDVGAPAVVLTGCSLFDNSNSSSALSVGGAATLTALSVSVVGGISGAGGITTTPTTGNITTGAAPTADPYANTSFPPMPASGPNPSPIHTTVTLSPGTYSGGLQLHASANVTLNPGIYYLDGGSLDVNASATLTGTGVTIVFTGSGANWATATINGGATVNLTAPTTGSTSGIVFFGDRNMPNGTAFTLNGGSSQTFGGAIYLPEAAVTINGASASGDPNACTQLVADTIKFSGNANFAVNCTGKGTKSIGSKTAALLE
jgi:Putative Flp pilus-assembly TadE/G-like